MAQMEQTGGDMRTDREVRLSYPFCLDCSIVSVPQLPKTEIVAVMIE